jgi:hypothetical protein
MLRAAGCHHTPKADDTFTVQETPFCTLHDSFHAAAEHHDDDDDDDDDDDVDNDNDNGIYTDPIQR